MGCPYGNEWIWPNPNHSYSATITSKANGPDGWVDDHQPYQPGQVIYGRETWMHALNKYNAYGSLMEPYKYLASVSEQYKEEWPKSFESSATMPKSAARIFLRIESVEVKRCRELTLRDAAGLGLILNAEECYPNQMNQTPAPWEAYCHISMFFMGRFGEARWHNNDWIWLYTFTKVDSLNP